jgi:hypothetical protein
VPLVVGERPELDLELKTRLLALPLSLADGRPGRVDEDRS